MKSSEKVAEEAQVWWEILNKKGREQVLKKYLVPELSVHQLKKEIIRIYINESEAINDKSIEADCLSRREHQVMKYLIQGLNHEQIAEECGITERTVCSHKFAIQRKWNSKGGVHLYIEALRRGYLIPGKKSRKYDNLDVLTSKETMVLHHIFHGHSMTEIANFHKLTKRTIEGYSHSIRVKWGIERSVEMVKIALQKGYINAIPIEKEQKGKSLKVYEVKPHEIYMTSPKP